MSHPWIHELSQPETTMGVSSPARKRLAEKVLGADTTAWAIDAARQMADHILRSVPDWPGDRSPEELEVLERATEASTIDTLLALSTGDLTIMSESLEPIENVAFYVQRGIPLGEVLRNVHAGEEFITKALLNEIEHYVPEAERLTAVKDMMQDVVTTWSLFARHVSLAYEAEAKRWLRSKDAIRVRAVGQLLEGGAQSTAEIARQLDYPLQQEHLAVSLTLPAADLDIARAFDFGVISRSLARAFRSPGDPLTVHRSATRYDLWIGTPRAESISKAAEALALPPGVHLAFGRTLPGPEGFRLSHLQARAAERVARFAAHPQVITDYADVELVSLLSVDLERARAFVLSSLGPLAQTGPRSAELRETLATYIDSGGSISDTAQRLHLHRNSVKYRLNQLEEAIGPDYNATRVRAAIELVDRVPQSLREASNSEEAAG